MTTFKSGFFLAFVLVATLVWFLQTAGKYEAPFFADKIVCFPMPDTTGRIPEVKSMMDKTSGDATRIKNLQTVMNTFQIPLKMAQEACSLETCEPLSRKDYRNALWEYIFQRESTTRNLYTERGEGGLVYAEEVFNTAADDDVIEHLQALVQAGRFDVSTLGDAKYSGALLAAKPSRPYIPCVKSETVKN